MCGAKRVLLSTNVLGNSSLTRAWHGQHEALLKSDLLRLHKQQIIADAVITLIIRKLPMTATRFRSHSCPSCSFEGIDRM